MVILNASTNNLVSVNCKIADSFISRFWGLMGKKELPEGSGLVITPCNSIHMFFMKFPLDIIFIDKGNVVLYLIEDIKPWKISKLVKNSLRVIELPVGTIKKSGTEIGHKLEFREY